MPVRDGTHIEGNCQLGANFDTGYGVVLRSCEIGDDVGIWSNSVIDPRAKIGDRTRIQACVYISADCVIGKDVFIGPNTALLNDKYPPRYDKSLWQPVVVEDGAVIGGGVTILPGVKIGAGAMVGGGSVVTKDVPPGELWYGNPARSHGLVDKQHENH